MENVPARAMVEATQDEECNAGAVADAITVETAAAAAAEAARRTKGARLPPMRAQAMCNAKCK